ncbi:hypothetical protein DDD_1719 [Nonlabens dokdonensis DSW-6]|uniref:Uncharacterized protein n=1 Tax=Nonlabens dokdonensis (strain DSM 17205 / KCTC 12402 / DSW-6) TaxID=592029 RepID=L7WAH8_NONDD|nr:hypothetical protein DDD_1719 [Nonlabens dokdonensis DSW-6]
MLTTLLNKLKRRGATEFIEVGLVKALQGLIKKINREAQVSQGSVAL